MSPRLLAPLVVLALALLGAGWWFTARDPVRLPPGPPATQDASREAVTLSIEYANEVDTGLASTRGAVPRPSELPEPGAEGARAGSLLSGRVVDDLLGKPLAGARVAITFRLHGEYSNLDLTHARSSRPVAEIESDAAGRFEVAVPEAVPLDVEVTARGYATVRRGHLFAGDDVLLRLGPAAILEGSLTRASDGGAVEGALVRGWDEGRVELFRARTGPAGTFQFGGLQPGVVTVAITPMAVAAPPWKKVELRAGARSRLDLVLESGVRIHGVVRDGEGRPIAGAEIGEGWVFRKSVFTNAFGEYELLGFGGPGVYDVHVRAAGFGGDSHEFPHDAMPEEDTRLDFALERGRSAVGRVVDPEGAPLEDVYAAGVASQWVDGGQRTDWKSSLTGPDGGFELTSLDPSLGHQLFLRKEGFGTRVYDFPLDEAHHAEVDLGEFVLLPGGRVAGSLRTRTGAPIPGYTVKLRGANGDLDRLRPDTDATNGSWYTSVRESRTDSTGRFHFADVPGGRFEVTATIRGKRDGGVEALVQLPESGRVEDVELTLDLGEPILGRVLAPGGEPAVGVFVRGLAGEAGVRIHAVSGAGGRFELLGVSEEMGEVALFTNLSSYNWANPSGRLGASPAVVARSGETGVTLTLRELVLLEGKVVDAAEESIAGVLVFAYPSGSPHGPEAQLASAFSDADGRFALELPEDAHVTLGTDAIRRGEGLGSNVLTGVEPVRLEWVPSDAKDVVLRIPD